MPQVSVIMPAYNAAPFISRAIESVLAQTYGDWELLVIDDGSTDGTEQVARSFPDARLRYVDQTNQGPAAARNLGLANSQGDYVIFLDADDWWDPRCLGSLAEAFCTAGPKDAVSHANWAYARDTGQVGKVVDSKMARGDALSTLILRNPLAIHSALVRRSALITVGGFPTDDPALEDWELWLRLAAAGYGFVHVPEVLAFYCWRPGSKGKDVPRRKADRLATLDRLWSRSDLTTEIRGIKATSYATAHIDFAVAELGLDHENAAWREIDQAIRWLPDIATAVDTFYRLSFASQATGEHDQERWLDDFDADNSARHVESLLQHFEASAQSNPLPFQMGEARFAAYSALGQAHYHQEELAGARRWWLRAAKAYPKKALQPAFVYSPVKACLPSSVLQALKGLRRGAVTWSIVKRS